MQFVVCVVPATLTVADFVPGETYSARRCDDDAVADGIATVNDTGTEADAAMPLAPDGWPVTGGRLAEPPPPPHAAKRPAATQSDARNARRRARMSELRKG